VVKERKQKYSFLKYQNYTKNRYSISPLRYEDILKIKKWRNEQISILRQKTPLTDNDQEKFFTDVIENTFYELKPDQILFSYFLDKKCIGYGGIVHIDWEKSVAEISFINETERAHVEIDYYNDFTNFIHLIFQIAFCELDLEKLTTETYGIRNVTLKILDELGFRLRDKINDYISIDGKQYDSLFHEYFKKDFNVNVGLN